MVIVWRIRAFTKERKIEEEHFQNCLKRVNSFLSAPELHTLRAATSAVAQPASSQSECVTVVVLIICKLLATLILVWEVARSVLALAVTEALMSGCLEMQIFIDILAA